MTAWMRQVLKSGLAALSILSGIAFSALVVICYGVR